MSFFIDMHYMYFNLTNMLTNCIYIDLTCIYCKNAIKVTLHIISTQYAIQD